MITASLDEQRGDVIAALVLERFGPPPPPPVSPAANDTEQDRLRRRRRLNRSLRE